MPEFTGVRAVEADLGAADGTSGDSAADNARTATDADLPANTLTFSLEGAPAGATIDAVTEAKTKEIMEV